MKPTKCTFLHETVYFDIFCIKIGAIMLAEGNWKNQEKTSGVHGKVVRSGKWNCLSNMDEFLWVSRHSEIITCAVFGDDRLRGLEWRGFKFAILLIDSSSLQTLHHYRGELKFKLLYLLNHIILSAISIKFSKYVASLAWILTYKVRKLGWNSCYHC